MAQISHKYNTRYKKHIKEYNRHAYCKHKLKFTGIKRSSEKSTIHKNPYRKSGEKFYNGTSNTDDESGDESGDELNDDSDDELNGELNKYEYAKFLNKLFPSSYSKSRINLLKRQRLISPKSVNKHNNFIDSNNSNDNHIIDNHIYIDETSVAGIDDEDINIDDNENEYEDDEDDEDDEYDEDDEDDEDDDKDYNKKKPDPKTLLSEKNYKQYKNIFTIEKNNESKYFKNSLTNEQQIEVLAKLSELNNIIKIEKPYFIHLVELNIPNYYKACAINKINMLKNMDIESANGEYYKLKSWIDSFIKIPFNNFSNIPIHISDGLEKCNDFIDNAKRILDESVYGLENAKLQIIQLIGLWMVNPNSVGTSIAIRGPMGVGKTTLIKEGVSKILNRYFAFIALGGANDISYFQGHGYTYEGSTYGKIIDILIQAKQMNPIIYFDELDKVSDSPKGEEITGLLTHLTDTTQNNCYHDKYFSEIDFDLSKILYIFSYNNESKIDPILKDRMYHIEIKGYTIEEKIIISKNYILPKIKTQVELNNNEIIISDDVIKYIINNYTDNEDGVRNLKRCFEIIYTKLNLFRLIKSDNDIFKNLLKLNNTINFPVSLTNDIVSKLITKPELNKPPFGMYT